LATINLVSAVILRVARPGDDEGSDPRAALPNYPDEEYAAQIFKETALTQSRVEYVPFIEWKRQSFEGETVTIGADGDRIDDVPDPTDPEAPSVHFYGGSTMWGEGSDDNGTIPASFALMNPQHRVFNHAEPAFVSHQGLESLIADLNEETSIDTAISYDGVNEVAVLCRSDTSAGGHLKEDAFRHRLTEGSSAFSLWQATKTLLFTRTQQLVDRLVREEDESEGGLPDDFFDCDDDPVKARAVAGTLLANWQHARAIGTVEGFEFIGILQPVAYVGTPRLDHLPGLTSDDPRQLAPQYEAVYPLVQEAIAESQKTWMVDLTHSFDGSRQIYIDFCHVTSDGNEIMAAAISKLIKP
jgi:hypothetical protein